MPHQHKTTPSTDIYGPGTFMDTDFTPAPQDAARIFEYITKNTPRSLKTKSFGMQSSFEGSELRSFPAHSRPSYYSCPTCHV
ncbi:hypothetical protein N7447_002579 [Penicillium robsamsonii]|uniref:uncharacterized protein n=1 Tax=Penicillium robsamsonii TaxID=1792511 RepID=UPI00254809F7|nr:uncharacterized protein N7447_002579 [Penicillium robsamsonii]KAJ5836553.1 hypothetical protein N7447_002579 [Penicillium robsamsonii]